MTNDDLIKEAVQILHRRNMGNTQIGSVASALITDKNTVFKGVCIDTISGMGFCAEHTAVSQMVTHREYNIKKIVAVKKDDNGDVFILPPCGRCREFMVRINEGNLETNVILDKNKTMKLKELLPYHNMENKISDKSV